MGLVCRPQPRQRGLSTLTGVASACTYTRTHHPLLLCDAGSLRRLEVETAGVLVVSQWAAALAQLHTACFIAGELHVKQVGARGMCARVRCKQAGAVDAIGDGLLRTQPVSPALASS